MPQRIDVTVGQKFGRWTVTAVILDKTWQNKEKRSLRLRCECGRERTAKTVQAANSSEACGLCRIHVRRRRDLTGKRFGRLRVTSKAPLRNRVTRFNCLCDCGNSVVVSTSKLATGWTRSCGCLRREATIQASTVHGMTRTAEHRAWQGAKRRCTDPALRSYADYGGRGIRMCSEWLNDFAAFFAHIGPRPSPSHSLDRIDTNGHYKPGNVRWATVEQQANNKRSTRLLTVGNATHSIAAWARITGIVESVIWKRL